MVGSGYSPTPRAGAWVSEGLAASCAGGVTKQKPDLAASVPFWEVGLVPRDEGTSGKVEKTSLPAADMIKRA